MEILDEVKELCVIRTGW